MFVQIVIGPMYSGKTTRLFINHNLKDGLIIDFCEDETNEGYVKNHKGETRQCIRTNRLCSIENSQFKDEFSKQINIYINEAQFFPDLLEFVQKHESLKNIYIYGLDGDYQRKPFGQILDVIPYCDSVEKLRGVCVCGKLSIHSKRITEDKEQYLLDENAYVPACRYCYSL